MPSYDARSLGSVVGILLDGLAILLLLLVDWIDVIRAGAPFASQSSLLKTLDSNFLVEIALILR